MTTNELTEPIGKIAQHRHGSMTFKVTVIDTKMSYGKLRYQIKPVEGSGAAWVEHLVFAD